MRKTLLYVLAGAVMAMMLVVVSCSNDDNNPTGGGTKKTTLRVMSVSPTDQQQGVAVTTPISLKFNTAVDTASFNKAFFVTGGPAMLVWVDSLSTGLSTGTVDYGRMLAWLDSVSTPGVVTWNAAGDSVTFVADSAFTLDTDYMIYLHNGVRGRGGEKMKTDSLTYGSYTSFFHTSPTAVAGRP